MALLELKKSLHEKIDKINDLALLEFIEEILDNWQEDIKVGHVYAMENLKKRHEKWLNN